MLTIFDRNFFQVKAQFFYVWFYTHDIYIFQICFSALFAMQNTLFDEFVIAHTLGWWGKAIMVRNLPLLWILSMGFEMAEVIFLYFYSLFARLLQFRITCGSDFLVLCAAAERIQCFVPL